MHLRAMRTKCYRYRAKPLKDVFTLKVIDRTKNAG
jgi:hypothetical protein